MISTWMTFRNYNPIITMDERTKMKEIAKKVTESHKSAQEFLKAAGIMTPEGELSSNYIA